MSDKYRVKVGNDNHKPWGHFGRDNLEYSARELGFEDEYIEELTDQELHNQIIKEGCRQTAIKEEV